MKCPSEGDLRAMLAGGRDRNLREHVAGCPRCTTRSEEIESAAALAQGRLALLDGAERPDAIRALNKFKARAEVSYPTANTERTYGMSEFGTRKLRPALAGGALVVALVALLAISPVRSAALGLLNVFRVEKFAAITIDPSKMPVQMQERIEKDGKEHFEHDRNAFGTYSGPLKPEKGEEVASLDAAENQVGYELASAGNTLGGYKLNKVYVTQEQRASYTFDTAKIRAKLEERGLGRVKAPEQIDGKTFTANFPQGVLVQYGLEKNSVVFAQGPSPSLTIPEGVNMDYLRQDFLMLPGLPAEVAAQVKEIEDWEHTLIVPIPPGGSSKEVKIDGAEGLLISDKTGENNGVLWQAGGKLYALGGKIAPTEALSAARAIDVP